MGEAIVYSVDEVVQQASPERCGSPFNGRPFLNGKGLGQRLSPYDRRQPPSIINFDNKHSVVGGRVVKAQPEARLSVRCDHKEGHGSISTEVI